MQFIAADFVQTTLSAAATSTDTSLSITSATGIPALVDGQALPITLINAATQTVYEICYITAISGTTITVLRGQEGTVAQSWSIGDLVKSCRTSGTTGSVVGTLVPAGSFTLPAGNSPTLILTDSITADSTFTLPAAPLAGTGFTVFGSTAAYTTTVASPVTSGSPYIEMPDGSQVYSYVIPASSPGAGIRLDFDGTNYRATTFGQVAPQGIHYTGGTAASTTYGQTITFTAPSNGWVCMSCMYNNSTLTSLGDIRENLIINGTTVVSDGAVDPNMWSLYGFLYVTAGTAVSATAEYVVGTTALTDVVYLRGLVWFVPST